jgi:hypothetical protein
MQRGLHIQYLAEAVAHARKQKGGGGGDGKKRRDNKAGWGSLLFPFSFPFIFSLSFFFSFADAVVGHYRAKGAISQSRARLATRDSNL